MAKYKFEIKWAVIFVIMQLLWMVIERISGLYTEHIDKHAIYTNFIAIPAIVIYFLALLDKRKNYFKGSMNYKQGLVMGILLTIIVTILSPLTQYITTTFIANEYFPNIIKYSVESGKLDQEAASAYFNLKSFIVQGLIGTPIMGIITALIVAFFAKSKKIEEVKKSK